MAFICTIIVNLYLAVLSLAMRVNKHIQPNPNLKPTEALVSAWKIWFDRLDHAQQSPSRVGNPDHGKTVAGATMVKITAFFTRLRPKRDFATARICANRTPEGRRPRGLPPRSSHPYRMRFNEKNQGHGHGCRT
jgi:hypothetical protein